MRWPGLAREVDALRRAVEPLLGPPGRVDDLTRLARRPDQRRRRAHRPPHRGPVPVVAAAARRPGPRRPLLDELAGWLGRGLPALPRRRRPPAGVLVLAPRRRRGAALADARLGRRLPRPAGVGRAGGGLARPATPRRRPPHPAERRVVLVREPPDPRRLDPPPVGRARRARRRRTLPSIARLVGRPAATEAGARAAAVPHGPRAAPSDAAPDRAAGAPGGDLAARPGRRPRRRGRHRARAVRGRRRRPRPGRDRLALPADHRRARAGRLRRHRPARRAPRAATPGPSSSSPPACPGSRRPPTSPAASTVDAAPALRFGVGAWPAVAAAVVAHLLYLLADDADDGPYSRPSPGRPSRPASPRPTPARRTARPTPRPATARGRPRCGTPTAHGALPTVSHLMDPRRGLPRHRRRRPQSPPHPTRSRSTSYPRPRSPEDAAMTAAPEPTDDDRHRARTTTTNEPTDNEIKATHLCITIRWCAPPAPPWRRRLRECRRADDLLRAHRGYLPDAVATGRENYYTGAVAAGEPPGRWCGRGAEALGLAGSVDAQDMPALYERFLDPRDERFRDPARWDEAATLGHTGRRYLSEDELYAGAGREPDASAERRAELRLEAGKQARHNVAFLDVTFTVPKSVTVLHTAFEAQEVTARAAGDEETAAGVGARTARRSRTRSGRATTPRWPTCRERPATPGSATTAAPPAAGSTRTTGSSRRSSSTTPATTTRSCTSTTRSSTASQGPDGVWRTLDGRSLLRWRPAAAGGRRADHGGAPDPRARGAGRDPPGRQGPRGRRRRRRR